MRHAVLFDLGGTLDGDGEYWLDRFARVYAAAGLTVPKAVLRDAFDEAERRAAIDETIATAGLSAMVERHVGWQLERLSKSDAGLCRDISARFAGLMLDTAAASRKLLSTLSARGLRLGVVSNGCGNVEVLCKDLGFSPFLSAIVDSRRVGLFKPDPAIFVHAAERLGLTPSSILMVGDSLDRDMAPAKSIGMQTAWLEGPRERPCPDARLVDVRLRTLADLPAALGRWAAAARTVA